MKFPQKKNEFYFISNNGSKKEPSENDMYVTSEWKLVRSFPFLEKKFIIYKFRSDVWVNTNIKEVRKNKLIKINRKSFSINNAIRRIIANL